MRDKRRILTIATTFFVAAAIGHVMQNPATLTDAYARITGQVAPVQIKTVAASAVDLPQLPGLPDAAPTLLGNGKGLGVRMSGLDSGQAAPPVMDAAFDAFGLPCSSALSVTAAPGAMLDVALQANCRPNEPAVLRHAGLTLSIVTDPDGRVALRLPAMRSTAEVAVDFADGARATATTAVPDLRAFGRVALSWQGTAALSLRPLENGAAAPLRVGDEAAPVPMLADIYTFARDAAPARILIEAEVTKWNCGGEAAGRTIVLGSGEAGAVQTDLTIAMPNCDAVGDFVQMTPDVGPLRIVQR